MGFFDIDEDDIFVGAKDAFPKMPTLDADFERAMNFTAEGFEEPEEDEEPAFVKKIQSNENERIERLFSGEQPLQDDNVFLKRYEDNYFAPRNDQFKGLGKDAGKKSKGLKGIFGL